MTSNLCPSDPSLLGYMILVEKPTNDNFILYVLVCLLVIFNLLQVFFLLKLSIPRNICDLSVDQNQTYKLFIPIAPFSITSMLYEANKSMSENIVKSFLLNERNSIFEPCLIYREFCFRVLINRINRKVTRSVRF